jgi:hypothetical protein
MTREQEEASLDLANAIVLAIGESADVQSAVRALNALGKRTELVMEAYLHDLQPKVADADAEFLRTLRIAPDLVPKEES